MRTARSNDSGRKKGARGDHLVARTAVLSAILTVALGAGLGQAISRVTTTRALADARGEAEVLARVGIQPSLQQSDLWNGLAADRRAALDQAMASPTARREIARMKIWNLKGQVIYSDEPRLIGQSFPVDGDLREAFEGHGSADISNLSAAENNLDRSLGPLLEVYVPLRFSPTGPVEGAFEIYRPYAPVAAATRRDTRRVLAELAAALAVLWGGVLWVVAGASRRLRAQAAVNRHQARHDQLTGLPNRYSFHEHLHDVSVDGRASTVLLVDLDRFAEINDTLGHHVGDELLRIVGQRLAAALESIGVVARLGGDEFAVSLPDVDGDQQAEAAAQVVARVLAEPVAIDGLTLAAAGSIGVAVGRAGEVDADTLLRQADVAMYVAKARRDGPQLYEPGLDHYSPARLALVADLREAIASRALTVHYQPKVSMADGRLVGVEALARWDHPTLGAISPVEFIPLAEQTGLIGPLTDVVLEQSLAAVSAWRAAGLDISVAVNLSVQSLYDDDLPTKLAGLLAEHDLSPDALEIEITESTAMDRPAAAAQVLSRVAAIGVAIAIDDFGTGHSSMAYLRQLPVSSLKIDRSFVLDMDRADGDAAIVRAIVGLAHSLSLEVVAEGVETPAAWATLAALGCDVAQGFLVARPLPADAFERWVGQWHADPAAVAVTS
jgi:diguanylate cyclase (GGDEF)-like protein